MPSYAGNNGKGGILRLNPGDEANVTDAIGKLLLQRYSNNFEQMPDQEKPAHAPQADKFYRKGSKTKTKGSRKKKAS